MEDVLVQSLSKWIGQLQCHGLCPGQRSRNGGESHELNYGVILSLLCALDQSKKRLPSTLLIAWRRAFRRVYSLTVGLAAVGST